MKGNKKLKLEVAKEGKEFLSRSSIHGLSYFFDDFHVVERLFWMLLTLVMFIIAFVWISISIKQWGDDKVSTITKSTTHSAIHVQFPTVTVCPDFNLDKWAMPRDILDRMKYISKELEGNPLQIDDTIFHIQPERMNETIFLLSHLIYQNALDMLDKLDRTVENHKQFSDNQDLRLSIENHKLYPFLHEAIVDIDDVNERNPYYEREKYENETGKLLGKLLHKTILGSRDNFDFYDALNYTKEYASIGSIADALNLNLTRDLNTTAELRRAVLLSAAALALPHPGFYGTQVSYYIDEYLKRTNKNMYLWSTLVGKGHEWYLNLRDDEYHVYLQAQFEEIFNQMTGQKDSGISIFDIPAILNPVKSYTGNHKFPRQFTYTLMRHFGRQIGFNKKQAKQMTSDHWGPYYHGILDVLENYTISDEKIQGVRAFNFLENNYFGKLLGPHLAAVMEIQQFAMLRPYVVSSKSRSTELRDVYKNALDNLFFPMDTNRQHFPTWSTYFLDWKWSFAPEKLFKQFAREFRSGTDPAYLASHPEFAYSYFANFPSWNMIEYEMTYRVNNEANKAFSTKTRNRESPESLQKLKDLYQYNNMMPLCVSPEGRNISCIDNFDPVLTDQGICFAYNAMNFSSSIKSSPYSKLFEKIFRPSTSPWLGQNITGSGMSYSMFLVLDSFNSKFIDPLRGRFLISINQLTDFVNVKDSAVEAELGYTTELLVRPTLHTSSDTVKQMSNSDRKCLYSHEEYGESQKLFKYYSQKTCKFECRLKYASETCGCTPWNYPRLHNGTITEICDGPNSLCFEQKISEELTCDCPPNCDEITHSVVVNKYRTNFDLECTPQPHLENDLSRIVGEKLRHMPGEEFQYVRKSIKKGGRDSFVWLFDYLKLNRYYKYLNPDLGKTACENYLQHDFALIYIIIDSPIINNLEKVEAVDMITKIGTLGGTLGLFSGVSIIGMFEILFWIWRILRVSMKPHKPGKRKTEVA